jgi:hypothetical protein
VAAHAEVADVVEVDDCGAGGWVYGFEEQGSDDDLRAARLADDR